MIKLAQIFNDHSPQVVNTLDLLYWPSVADLSETNEILQHIQKFERHSRDIPIQILRQRNFAYAKLKNCVNNTSERGELPDCYRIFYFFSIIKHLHTNLKTFTTITRYITDCYTWEN